MSANGGGGGYPLSASVLLSGGLNHLFQRSFSVSMDMVKDSFLWSEEIIVIGYNLLSFLYNFMENISVLIKCNVLFNNEHLILISFF